MDFYRTSTGGYPPTWGPPTSTLNFCEEDYQFSPHIAELYNTASNIIYIGLGSHGLFNNSQRGAKGIAENLPFAALIILGIGSSLFHTSLKYTTQLIDEFSMLFGTFIVFYRLLCLSPRFSPNVILAGLAIQMGIVIAGQIITGGSTVQQVTFVAMIWYLWSQSFALIKNTVKSPVVQRKMRIMAISGIIFFCTGHVCWLTDFFACSGLRSLRHQIGMPWAAALELHGWWHIFTGIGVYVFIVLVECLQHAARPELLGVSSSWPLLVHIKKDPLLAKTPAGKAKKTL